MAPYDDCPKCGRTKRSKNQQCATCRGYGLKRHVMPSGYVRLFAPEHPVANADGHALEHRLVLHDAGITVPPGWHVHHLNGDKTDNALENLAVLRAGAHARLHQREVGYVENQHGRWPLRRAA